MGRHVIGRKLFGSLAAEDFGTNVVFPVVNHSGIVFGSSIMAFVSFAKDSCVLVKCFHQTFWMLSTPRLFQFAKFSMLLRISFVEMFVVLYLLSFRNF